MMRITTPVAALLLAAAAPAQLTCDAILSAQSCGPQLTITFTPNDGADLKATELTFEKMTLAKEFITATQRKDGNNLVIELAVANNAPTGLVKGELVVKLNHPLIKEKRVMFNGFVR